MSEIDAAELTRMRADVSEAKAKCAWHVNVNPDTVLSLIDELEKARAAQQPTQSDEERAHRDIGLGGRECDCHAGVRNSQQTSDSLSEGVRSYAVRERAFVFIDLVRRQDKDGLPYFQADWLADMYVAALGERIAERDSARALLREVSGWPRTHPLTLALHWRIAKHLGD